MTSEKLKEALKAYKEYQRLAEELAAEMDGIKDEIKAELTRRGVDELTAGEYRVTWKAVTSTRVDTAALKMALPDVAERFSKTTTAKRLCVA